VDFQVGQKVIYPNHGVGIVESIQTRPTPTGKISLYQLRILSNDSRVWVPQQNADGVGLRSVITAADVRKIMSLLADGNIDQHSNG
jgi:CarD family transcriptional regulator